MSLTLYTFPTNFRAIKALVAAQYAGVDVDVPAFTMGKDNVTDEFMAKSPLGKVPCLDTKDGPIFQSNAIARYIARLRADSGLCGGSFYESGQVDSWMDFCTNEVEVPATMWVYPILGYMEPNADASAEAEKHLAASLKAMNTHLQFRTFFVGERVTLADVCLFSALYYPLKFVMDKKYRKEFGNVVRWANTCAAQAEFQAVIGSSMTLCNKRCVAKGGAKKAAKKEKKKAAPKKEAPKKEKPKTLKDIFNALPKSKLNLDAWKKIYSNTKDKKSVMQQFYDMYEPEKAGWSLYNIRYNYNDDNTILWKTSNLVNGFVERCDSFRKFAMGTVQMLTNIDESAEDSYASGKGNIFLRGAFLIRSSEGSTHMIRENPDAEYWTWEKVDLSNKDQKAAFEEAWCNIYPGNEGGTNIMPSDGKKLYDAAEFK
jgi:elongation factor 1-gamma